MYVYARTLALVTVKLMFVLFRVTSGKKLGACAQAVVAGTGKLHLT